MSRVLNVGSREQASQMPALYFKISDLGPKSAIYFCSKPPYNLLKTARRREIVATLHMQLDFPVPNSNPTTRSTGCKKRTFFKNGPWPYGMPKQAVLALFELRRALCGPPEIPKCLENGLFWDQKWVKNGSKMCFSKNDPRSFGVL